MSGLANEKIVDGAAALDADRIREKLVELPGWELASDGKSLSRDWQLKNFKRAAELASLAAWQAEAANHHPDISFGWGHVRVVFSTHSANGVTLNDLIMAARLSKAAD